MHIYKLPLVQMSNQQKEYQSNCIDIEISSKRSLLVQLSLTSCAIFFLFRDSHLVQVFTPFGFLEVLLGISPLLCLHILRRTQGYKVAVRSLLLSIYAMSAFLFASGGIGGTGYIWSFFVPIITLLFFSWMDASRWLVVYLLILAFVVIAHAVGVFNLPYSHTSLRQGIVVYILYNYIHFKKASLTETLIGFLRDKNSQLIKGNMIDCLTCLPNRTQFRKLIRKEYARSMRRNYPISVVTIHIDESQSDNYAFKHFNSDDIMVQIAHFLESRVRESDTVIRWEGSNFIILCPDTKREGALIVSSSLRELFLKNTIKSRTAIGLKFSVIQFSQDESIEGFIRRIDDFFYQETDGEDNNRVVAH